MTNVKPEKLRQRTGIVMELIDKKRVKRKKEGVEPFGLRCDACTRPIKFGANANLEWEFSTLQSCWIVHSECSNLLRKFKSKEIPAYELLWCWKPLKWDWF